VSGIFKLTSVFMVCIAILCMARSCERSVKCLSMAAVQCAIHMASSTTTIQLGRKQ
jgi:D-alanine-D-alanine ligase-like ATP-grasp enzyme